MLDTPPKVKCLAILPQSVASSVGWKDWERGLSVEGNYPAVVNTLHSNMYGQGQCGSRFRGVSKVQILNGSTLL